MLKKLNRLPAKQRLLHSTFYKTPDFGLRVASNNLDVSRFGFIVKKSVDKRATVRNRARRVLRSCIEEMLAGIKDGRDMLFSLEKGIIAKDRQAVCENLQKLLEEKGLLQ